MNFNYKGLIFTDHALKRTRERGISLNNIWATWYKPDRSRYDVNKKAWVYTKSFNAESIEIVVKQNENKEWVILSAWLKSSNIPPKQGSLTNLFFLIKKIFSK